MKNGHILARSNVAAGALYLKSFLIGHADSEAMLEMEKKSGTLILI